MFLVLMLQFPVGHFKEGRTPHRTVAGWDSSKDEQGSPLPCELATIESTVSQGSVNMERVKMVLTVNP